MKTTWRTYLAVGAGLVFLSALSLLQTGCVVQESPARHKLDQMLGQASEQPSESDWPGLQMPQMPNLLDMAMLQAVDVQETAKAYVLRIPLASAKDADQVQVNVSPNRIEVSGQTGSKHGAAAMTSSFMQSFTTSQTVIPSQMSRKIEKQGDKDTLVVTIPKDAHAPLNPEQPVLPKAQTSEPLPNVPMDGDASEDLPLNDGSHRVI